LPVTVAEAKAYCRIDFDDDDEMLMGLIGAATEYVEQATDRAFVERILLFTQHNWGGDEILYLPVSPVQSVTSVKYRDTGGALVTMTQDQHYRVDVASEPAVVYTINLAPPTGDYPDAVQVIYVAGYQGDASSPTNLRANVPDMAKLVIKVLVAHWYELNPVPHGPCQREIPLHVSRLLNTLKTWFF
jgi:uncharacterized phiE125 gp8 family phage protein